MEEGGAGGVPRPGAEILSVPVKVDLEQTRDGRRVFRLDGSEAEDDRSVPLQRGMRGWLARKFHALEHGFRHAKNDLARTTRRVWGWLQRRMPPDEPILIRLRTVPAIEVHHPPALPAHEARADWSAFLARRRRRHGAWLILNALIAPLTVLLAPLPGPNLVGYWFAYRAVRDLLAVLGANRALSGKVETTFRGDQAGVAMLGSADGTRPRCDS
jgi:hypothetical protein